MAQGFVARGALIAAIVFLGSSCGGGGGDSASSSAPESLKRITLPGFPHAIDVYEIDDADKAVVVLHGGGGTNEMIAYNLGLTFSGAPPTPGTVNWAWLHEHRVIAVFPQGQAIQEDPNSYAWTNHVMTSGQDDVAFLQDLAGYIRDQYGINKVYLVGHSTGGMMANRMWCESPETFDAYISIAGPASSDYLDPGTPCTPATVQPYYGIVGDEDGVLQNGNWEATTWQIAPAIVSASADAFVDPELIGEWHQQLARAQLMCDEQPQSGGAIHGGAVDTWTNCGGRLKLQRIAGGKHFIDSLETAAGIRVIDAAADFIDGLQ